MCGIWFSKAYNKKFSYKIQHRGPDSTVMTTVKDNLFVFHRLSINDMSTNGNQPMKVNDSVLMCNGEIYNHKFLRSYLPNSKFISDCDCEPIVHMIDSGVHMFKICNSLDGVFSFVAMKGDIVYAARDPIGVRPLFYGIDSSDGSLTFCSEVKGLQDFCEYVAEFPKGHYYTSIDNKFHKYHDVKEVSKQFLPYSAQTLKAILESAVQKRLMSERPVGFFLSGGLDSSLIAALGSKFLGKIHTFSIGIGESPDLVAAKKVSDHIGSVHTEIKFTTNQALSILNEVITSLESYDCTTIRASVPMYILSEYVSKNTDFKVILSGEGADELFGGYLYFHNAPTTADFQAETLRLLDNVHSHDVLRADRCTASHGLELRVPFFDRALLSYVKSIDPMYKKPHEIEKYILRYAFDGEDLLPKEILWRQKNGMSDAVGYSWVDFIKEYSSKHISDTEFENQKDLFQRNTPLTKEEYFYRKIYDAKFPQVDFLPHVWRPLWTNQTDPSATLLSVHKK